MHPLRRSMDPPVIALGVLAFALFSACSGSGLPGCSAITPLSTRYAGEKTDNAVNIRVSPSGINFLNSNWKTLLETFAPGQKLDFPLGCMVVEAPVLGSVTIADQGDATGAGRADGKCECKDRPQNVSVTITGFGMVPKAPDQVELTLTLQIATGKVFLSSTGNACLLSRLECSFDLNTGRDPNPASNTFRAVTQFTIDTKWDKLLAFAVTSLDGTKVCGSSGALAPPQCLQPDDIDINGENICGNIACTVADIGLFKNFILRIISPMLESQVKNAIAAQACESCGTGLAACPQLGPGAQSICERGGPGCDGTTPGVGKCIDTATKRCVPRLLGMEGRLAPAALLKSFGVPENAQLDFSFAGGSSMNIDTGMNIGTRGGLSATNKSDCVPTVNPPILTKVTAPNFDQEATPGARYHVGVSLSQPLLDLSLHHAHQSGALCLSLSSETTTLLSTGLFRTFLPSLGKLATRDGRDAPMRVVVKPKTPPTLVVGQGTYDPGTKRPIKPLLMLEMHEVTIDLYVMLDERYVRLFSLTADLSVPLSVIFSGCDTITPALGDLKQLITHVRTANSEILAEDPEALAQLIPTLISFLEPAVATALQPIAIPALAGFKLKVSEAKGLVPIAGTDAYNHLGLYAELVLANAQCARSAPTAVASLKRSVIPSAAELRLSSERPLPWPVAVLDVKALGADGTAEYAYRVDGGLWTTFLAPTAAGELEVTHPRLLLQGVHTLEVRARMAEDPHGVSAPVAVPFRVDYEPPEVTLTADAASNRLRVAAHDAVTPDSALRFAFKVGDGALSSFGALRPVDLAAIEAAGSLEVQVQDESGNVGRAVYRAAVISGRGAAEESTEAAGCSAAGGAGQLLALGLLAGLLRRRRRGSTRTARRPPFASSVAPSGA